MTTEQIEQIKQALIRGYMTLEELPKDLSAAEAAELASVQPCPHKEVLTVMVVSACANPECGRRFYLHVEDPLMLAATQVMQGLVDIGSLKASGQFTEEELAFLATVPVCEHPADKREVCTCGGLAKERCTACGRRFADSSQFVLDHGVTNG